MRKPDQWWDVAWNPVTGCDRVSEGCDNCWARAMNRRFKGGFDIVHHYSRYEQPFRLGSVPKRVFVVNMGDLFHPLITDHEILRFFMFMIPPHQYFVLTKRPERMARFVKDVLSKAEGFNADVMLGTSIENQKAADQRLPWMEQIHGFRKFVSVEPMLGPVDLHLSEIELDWVVCGAETGPGARKMDHKWAVDLCNHCHFSGVPFFFKSAGNRTRIPHNLEVRQYPQKSFALKK